MIVTMMVTLHCINAKHWKLKIVRLKWVLMFSPKIKRDKHLRKCIQGCGSRPISTLTKDNVGTATEIT